MKTIRIYTFLVIIAIVLSMTLFFACRKNNINNEPPPISLINGSVAGRVTDLNDVLVSNASVTAGAITTTTDMDGHFIIKNAQLIKDAGFVEVAKPGFFTGSRTFLVNTNTLNNVKIQLIPKIVSGNFVATSGGSIDVLGGGSVNFGANNTVTVSNNAAYTGNVSVSTFYLNPADANFSKYMPGDLQGLNSSNQQKILQSFGIVLIEMNDASGGKLQIATGKTATITIPIPTAMQASAPATLPLWYFDETKGVWKQEGSATKQSNNYVGTVAHFSFWTAGQLGQNVRLDATFKDQNGNILANNLVTITSTNYGTSDGYTDSAGTVSGLIPANETLVMKAIDQCNNIIYTQNIGPFSTDTNLGNITVTVNTFNCIADNQFINLTLNGVNYSWYYSSSSGSRVDSTTSIIGGRTDSLPYVVGTIFSGNTSPGNYIFRLYTIINNNVAYNTWYNNPNTVVTEYGAVGGYISGTASGWVKNFPVATSDSFPFSYSYRVKRIQ